MRNQILPGDAIVIDGLERFQHYRIPDAASWVTIRGGSCRHKLPGSMEKLFWNGYKTPYEEYENPWFSGDGGMGTCLALLAPSLMSRKTNVPR